RGATSYAANWHAFRGGWGEDWQGGGKARIPDTFPAGPSNTLAYFERHAIRGDPTKQTGIFYVEHLWGQDGQNVGPIAEHYNSNAWFTPAWWASYPGGFDLGNTTVYPRGYPLLVSSTGVVISNYVTLPQVAPPIKACDPRRLQTLSTGGLQVLMCDASVKTVSTSISQLTWAIAVLPDDGLSLGSDW